jgi:Zn-dependent protease with chaperone function
MKFSGGVYHNDLPKGRSGGSLIIENNCIKWRKAERNYSLSLNGLTITRGGSGDRVLFLRNRNKPDVTLYCLDHGILKDLLELADPSLIEEINKVKRRKKAGLYIVLSLIILIVSGVFGLIGLKDPLVVSIVDRIPFTWEQKLGETAFKQFTLTEKFREDSLTAIFLDDLSKPLLAGLPDSLPFKFYYSESAQINAFAMPGGIVVINDGLVKNAKTVEEIQGVLAHEIAHVTQRHGMRAIVSSIGMYTVLQAVVGDISGLLAIVLSNGDFLLRQQFSRDAEREADQEGFALLVKQEIDPQGMVDFFKLLKNKESDAAEVMSESLSFLNTHPATSERIENLQTKVDALGEKNWKQQETFLETYRDQSN